MKAAHPFGYAADVNRVGVSRELHSEPGHRTV